MAQSSLGRTSPNSPFYTSDLGFPFLRNQRTNVDIGLENDSQRLAEDSNGLLGFHYILHDFIWIGIWVSCLYFPD
jgi:hypothetical protein